MNIPRRALGASGLSVSCLGLGTVKLGRDRAVKYPLPFAIPDDPSARRLLAAAADLGFNLIDTAPAYGASEERLGRLLDPAGGWLICTKVGEEFGPAGSRHDFSAAHVEASVIRSLRRLRRDCLDIVLVHSDGRDEDIIDRSDCVETLLRLRDRGLIRLAGFSSKTVAGGLKALELLDVVMVTLNPAETDSLAVIEAARARGKGVLIKKALDSGKAGHDPAAIARQLRFALGSAGVASVIVGTINPRHLAANAAVAAALG